MCIPLLRACLPFGINDIGTACQIQPGEVIYFDVFGYIVLACFDSLTAESSCVLCVAILGTSGSAEYQEDG